MAKFQITSPTGEKFEITAPDGATEQDVMSYAQSQFAPQPPAQMNAAQPTMSQGQMTMPQPSYDKSYFAQGTSGVNEGIANTLGLPVDLMNMALGAGAKGVNALAGTDLKMSDQPFLGSSYIKENMGRAIRPPTDEAGKQMLRRVGQEVGASVVPAMGAAATAARPAAVLGNAALSALGSGTGAATAQQVFPNNPLAEMAGQFIGGSLPAAVSAFKGSPKGVVPTVDELKAQAGDLYKKAEQSGVIVPQAETQNISNVIKDVALKEGLISPTGRVSTAYPKASDALKTFDDYAQADMTIPQVQTARKTLSNIAKSTDPAEARIGSMMLDEFDNLIAPVSPELTQAKEIYRLAKKGELIDQTIDLAQSRAGQFSGSGYENALRTEFRNLERKIIKGQLKGLSQEEIDAISKVAQGGPLENAMRYLGKLAPTSTVNLAVSGGVPFAVGNAVGGPVVGAAASGLSMGAGFAGREAATRMASKNAQIASELARGGSAPQMARTLSDEKLRALAAVMAAQGTNQLNRQQNNGR